MLSSLARGCGSWTGDLEVANLKTNQQKPLLVPGLNGENTKFLKKSVRIPLRVKSAVSQSTSQSTSTSHARCAKTNAQRNLPTRPKSVCNTCSSEHFHEKPRERIHRTKSAASIFSQKSRSDFATCASCPSKYGTEHFNSKNQKSNGTVELPKTYMTRKGALMLFTAPENLLFSEPDQKCYFRKDQDETDVKKVSLTLGTVNKLTSSVLQYGSQHQLDDNADSDTESWREETHMQFVHNDEGDRDALDCRSQPGADFVFYLRDLQSRAVVHRLERTPSQQSLVSVDSATELTAALQNIDAKGSSELRRLIVQDPRKLHAKRQNVTGISNVRQLPKNALSRPSTSASGHSTPLSVEHLAASLKSSPYLGHPLKAPYPPNPTSYSTSPETKPSKTSGFDRQDSAHSRISSSSRGQSSSHSLRSQMSSREHESHNQDINKIRSESARSVTASQDGSLSVVDDDLSYRGNTTLSATLSPTHSQHRQHNSSHYSSEADLHVAVSDDADDESQLDASSLHPDWLAQDQFVRNPVYYKSTSSGTASPHTYVSVTTSVPTTIQDDQFKPDELALDDHADQDVLSLDHDALLLDHDTFLSDNPSDIDESLDAFQESTHSGQWPVDGVFSPVLSVRFVKSPGSSRPGSEARSFSPGPQATSPSLSVRSGRSLQPEESFEEPSDVLKSPTADRSKGLSPVIKVPSPAPAVDVATTVPQDNISSEGQLQRKHSAVSHASSAGLRSPSPRLQPRKANLADVVNRVAENELGVPYTTMVPPKFGPSDDLYATIAAGESTGFSRKSPSPPLLEKKAASETLKPAPLAKTISKLDLGNLKAMVKPPTANKTQSPRTARKSKGKGVRPKSTGVQFIDSLNIDSYQGPSEDEVEKMVQQELAKDLETGHLEQENTSLLVVPDDVTSLATDDEALEKELKKQAPQGKKRPKKILAKEKAALKEARQQEKLRHEEELEALQEKKKQREKEKRQQQIAEERQKQMAKEELEDAAAEAERAAEAEEEAREMLQETRRLAREEREARRKAEAEKRKQEKEQQRLERRKMEEAARQREQEMAERLASVAEKRRLREEAEWERQERERLEQEEREAEEEEEKQQLEEEEERIREAERQAEEEALARLVKEREEAEQRMGLAREEAERQKQEEERLRLEEGKRKAEEDERQRQLEAEAERKRKEELDKIKRIQRLEEEARERVQKELAHRRAWTVRRREQNQAQLDHLNSVRQTQGMTRPWVFSYYVHWPRKNYERRIFVAKKRQFRPRPKLTSKLEAGKP